MPYEVARNWRSRAGVGARQCVRVGLVRAAGQRTRRGGFGSKRSTFPLGLARSSSRPREVLGRGVPSCDETPAPPVPEPSDAQTPAQTSAGLDGSNRYCARRTWSHADSDTAEATFDEPARQAGHLTRKPAGRHAGSQQLTPVSARASSRRSVRPWTPSAYSRVVCSHPRRWLSPILPARPRGQLCRQSAEASLVLSRWRARPAERPGRRLLAAGRLQPPAEVRRRHPRPRPRG